MRSGSIYGMLHDTPTVMIMKERMIQSTNISCVSQERQFVHVKGDGVLTRLYHCEAGNFLRHVRIMCQSPCKRNDRTVQLHEVELIAPIQWIGICAHFIVLVLPQIYLSHPHGLPGGDNNGRNGTNPHNCEGKLVSRRGSCTRRACETWGHTTRQVAVSVIFSIAALK